MDSASRVERELATAVSGLNQTGVLERPIIVKVEQCAGQAGAEGQNLAGAFYIKPQGPRPGQVKVCHELLYFFDQLFACTAVSPSEAFVSGAVQFAMFHELGHALVDQHGLQMTCGSKTCSDEDAADRIGVVLQGDIMGGDGNLMGAEAWLSFEGLRKNEGDQYAWSVPLAKGPGCGQFWDSYHADVPLYSAHSMSEQRSLNVRCLFVELWPASEQERWMRYLGSMPYEDRKSCPTEFSRAKSDLTRQLKK